MQKNRHPISSHTRNARLARSVVETLERRELFSISYLGDATFSAAGDQTAMVEVGDLNNNNKADVVAFNAGDKTLSVYLGDGAGNLVASPTLTVGFNVGTLRIADLNGDGKRDIAVASANDSSAKFFAGNGDGTFGAGTDFNLDASRTDLQFGDITGDGRPEMFAPASSGTGIAVWKNTGVGPLIDFGDKIIYDGSTDTRPTGLALGDVNNDGKLDVIGANFGSECVNVLLNQGDGTYGPTVDYHTDLSTQLNEVKLADVNSDNKPDIVAAIYDGGFNVYLNQGGGTFAPAKAAVGLGGEGMGIADFDGDGKIDLASGNAFYSSINIYNGHNNGEFDEDESEYQFGSRLVDIEAADFNSDGKADFIFADRDHDRVGIVLNGSSGNGNPGGNPGQGADPGNAAGIDLAPSLATALPASVIGGDKGKATVVVTNHGDTKLNGPVTVQLFASTDGTLDDGDAPIVTLQKNLKIDAGKSKKVKLKFNFPSLADGSYQIIAKVTSDGTAETNTADNALAAGAVTIAAPFVDLSSSIASAPASLKSGKKAKVSVNLQNLGNIAHSGDVRVRLFASTDGTLNGATELTTLTKNLKIKSSKNKSVKLKFTAPAQFAGGSYYLVATTELTGVTDTVAGNNIAMTSSALAWEA